MKKHNISQRLAAKVCNLYKRAVQRIIVSFEKERELRQQEYPKLFKSAKEEAFVSIIDETEAKQKNLTYKQFQEHIIFLFYFLLYF